MSIAHIVTRGFGNGTFAGEIRQVVTRGFFDSAVAPLLVDTIRNIAAPLGSGAHVYALEDRFTGETSFSISPAVEIGWAFDTGTGELTIDTDDAGLFGPYTVTASNNSGSINSNAFYVNVAASSGIRSRGLNLTIGIGL